MRHTIAICTTGRRGALDASVRAVRESVAPENEGDTEVLVVVNGMSGDGASVARLLSDAFRGAHLQVRLVAEQMAGIARARNRALACALGAVLSFVDDDVRPSGPDWQRAILDAFASHPELGLLGGPLHCAVPPGANPDPWWRSPRTDGLLSCFAGPTSGPCKPEMVWTANGSYRLAATAGIWFPEELGWQSGSEFRLAGEDTWFNRCLAARGWTAWYAAQATADHHVEAARFAPLWLLKRAAVEGQTHLVFRCSEGAEPFSAKVRACAGLLFALFRAAEQAARLNRREAFTRCLDAAARAGALTLSSRDLHHIVDALRRDGLPLDDAPAGGPRREGVA